MCWTTFILFMLSLGSIYADSAGSEEELFIDEYLENMVYMVYIDEDSQIQEEDAFLLKKAIAAANNYLTSRSLEAVLLEEVEKLKQDQEIISIETSGEDISVIQWLARKLNADVYITINLRVTGETKRKNHYAQASITLTAFESSTGRLMGSKTYNQPEKSFSSTSEEEAKLNAVEVSIKRTMQDIINTSEKYMKKALKKGIKYEVFFEGAGDAETIAEFLNSLEKRVKDIETVYRTEEQAKCYVWALLTNQELEQLILDLAKTIPGLQGMTTVSLRRKSLTFVTGL
ncbi:MAG: hypothetical protein JW822_08670 [Spirochaetales bacterium]|nr:hypothetical protein [Spirochaetales bacterium]